MHRYQTIEKILEGIIRHAAEKNIPIWAEPGEQVNLDSLKANCNQQRKKRILSQKQTPIKRQKLNEKKVHTTTDVVKNTLPDFTDTVVPDFTDTIVPRFTDKIVPDLTNIKEVPISITTSIPPTITHNGAHKPLVLNGLVIEVDPDTFMINATQMCKAAGKEYYDYAKTAKANSFLQILKSKPIFIGLDLIKSNRGGNHSGTMVHRHIAYDLASWLSEDVRLQFYSWIDQLLLTGRVELGNEMSTQQLEELFEQRVTEAVKEKEAKAAMDMEAERNRCQEIILQKNELEQRIVVMEEDHQRSEEEKKAHLAIKAREELEETVQTLKRITEPTIASYNEGDNVLYLARIDDTKFKYGQTKNTTQRFGTHERPGVYPTFEPVSIFLCNNGVASEDKMRDYVKKKKIWAEYGTQREVINLDTKDDLLRFVKAMHKCCKKKVDDNIEIRRIDADLEIQKKRMDVDLEIQKKRMDVEVEKQRMELLMESKITFEQYLKMK